MSKSRNVNDTCTVDTGVRIAKDASHACFIAVTTYRQTTNENMKCISILLSYMLFHSSEAALPVSPTKTKTRSPAFKRVLQVNRGGDLGPIRSKTLAQTLAALASCDAIAGALAPITSMAWAGVDIESGSLSEHYLHGLAASAATTAVSTYLATSGKTSIEQAIGYGFIARLVSMASMVLNNKYHELGMNNAIFLGMMTVLAGTTYCLFSGKADAMALTKLVSMLLFFHGVFLYLNPEAFMKKSSAAVDPTALAMASIDGGYMVVSSLVTGLLAHGVSPEKVAGYASLVFLPVIAKLFDVITVEAFLGVSTGAWLAFVSALLAAIATGTIFD